MKNAIVFSLFTCIVSLLACGSSDEIEARKTVQVFFESLVKADNEKMVQLYPDKDKLGKWFPLDSFSILSEKQLPNDQIGVVVLCFKSIGSKKILDREIELFLEEKGGSDVENSYIIVDSKGVMSPIKEDQIQFAIKTGCLEANHTGTDQVLAEGFHKSEYVYRFIDAQLAKLVLSEVTVTDFKWVNEANGAFTGRAILNNYSEFELEKVKYIIKLKDSEGNTYMEKSDFVPALTIQTGTQKAFSFYFTEIGKPALASIKLKFDPEWIRNQVYNWPIAGNECEVLVY